MQNLSLHDSLIVPEVKVAVFSSSNQDVQHKDDGKEGDL